MENDKLNEKYLKDLTKIIRKYKAPLTDDELLGVGINPQLYRNQIQNSLLNEQSNSSYSMKELVSDVFEGLAMISGMVNLRFNPKYSFLEVWDEDKQKLNDETVDLESKLVDCPIFREKVKNKIPVYNLENRAIFTEVCER
jgi:hypothetical protein